MFKKLLDDLLQSTTEQQRPQKYNNFCMKTFYESEMNGCNVIVIDMDNILANYDVIHQSLEPGMDCNGGYLHHCLYTVIINPYSERLISVNFTTSLCTDYADAFMGTTIQLDNDIDHTILRTFVKNTPQFYTFLPYSYRLSWLFQDLRSKGMEIELYDEWYVINWRSKFFIVQSLTFCHIYLLSEKHNWSKLQEHQLDDCDSLVFKWSEHVNGRYMNEEDKCHLDSYYNYDWKTRNCYCKQSPIPTYMRQLYEH